MENATRRAYRANLPSASEKLRAWSPDRADPVVSLDQFIPFRPRMGHGQFLAGLVRDHSPAGRIDSGLDRRAVIRRAARSRLGHLCERNRFAFTRSG